MLLLPRVRVQMCVQVFTVTNRGGMPARFKVYFRKPDPHTKLANHGYVHYSLAGVVSFPSIVAHFTVEFHFNVVGSFSNVLVLQTETREIEVPFEARVNPQVQYFLFWVCFLFASLFVPQ